MRQNDEKFKAHTGPCELKKLIWPHMHVRVRLTQKTLQVHMSYQSFEWLE